MNKFSKALKMYKNLSIFKDIMDLAHMFSRPLLIYDDRCSSCTKFAKTANILSRGWIRTVGHYYSEEAMQVKKIIFPTDYDSTKMFWLINRNGAYGARSGLIQVIKEVIIGLFKGKGVKRDWNNNNIYMACEYKDQMISCGSTENTLRRITNMIRNSDKFQF
jgi:hypothetical protein